MEDLFSFTVPEAVRAVIDCLERAGYPTYVVGGAVRDTLCGKQPHDYDLCTSALPEQVEQVCSAYHVVETGLHHGTISVIVDGMCVEVTTFRTESAYSDGRRPDCVAFVSNIEDDLRRRDFTINAMAWCPARGLCDPFGGQIDLSRRVIRCVGDADARFREDALRILRALRFAAQRGFSIESDTAEALRRNKAQLAHVSAERVTAELLQLICGAYIGEVLLSFSDIIAQVLPEIRPMIGFDQRNPHHKYTLWEHAVRAMEGIRPQPLLRLVMMMHDVGKPATYTQDANGVGHFYRHAVLSQSISQQALQHLRLPSQMEHDLLYLVRHHDIPLGVTEREVRRKLAVNGERYFRALLAIQKADCIGQGTAPDNIVSLVETEQMLEQVLEADACLKRSDLAINGHDLMAWGVHGRAIGRYLSAMLNDVIDHPSHNTRDGLRALFECLRAQENRAELTVNGMSASHCAREVCALIEKVQGIAQVDVSLASGKVVIVGKQKHMPLDEIRVILMAAGYEVAI